MPAQVKVDVLKAIVRAAHPTKVRELSEHNSFRFEVSRYAAAAIAMDRGFRKIDGSLDLEVAAEYINRVHPRI